MTAHRAPLKRQARWPGRLLLGFWLLLLVTALWNDPVSRRGLYREEATSWLAAESLVHDRDRVLTKTDIDRFRSVWQRPLEEVLVARGAGDRAILASPTAYALILAPAVAVAPARGAFVLQVLLFGLALWCSARVLGRTLGASGMLWLAVAAFGSVAFAAAFRLTPSFLGMVLAVVAVALSEGASPNDSESGPMPEVYGETPAAAGRGGGMRWLAVGVLTGLAASLHPLFACILIPLAVRSGGAGRWRRWGLLVGGAAVVLALVGFWQSQAGLSASPWPVSTDRYTLQTGFPDPAHAWPEPASNRRLIRRMALGDRFDPHLAGWNALYLLAGRHIGIVPCFLPVLLALGLWAPGTRRWPLVAAGGLALVGAMVMDPFRLGGSSASIGNGLFLPFYGVVWFLPTRAPRGWQLIAVVAVAGVLIWPLWLAPAGYPVDDAGRSRQVSPMSQQVLPYETTQQSLPGGAYVAFAGVHVRAATGTVWEDPARHSFRMLGKRGGEVVIAYAGPIESVDLTFGKEAPTGMKVEGGSLESTVFRPSGGVTFRIRLNPTARRHPMWWSTGLQYLYPLRLSLPKAPESPLRFSLAVERGRRG